MEMIKAEMDAVLEIVESNKDGVSDLAELQLAMVGGGVTDVTFH